MTFGELANVLRGFKKVFHWYLCLLILKPRIKRWLQAIQLPTINSFTMVFRVWLNVCMTVWIRFSFLLHSPHKTQTNQSTNQLAYAAWYCAQYRHPPPHYNRTKRDRQWDETARHAQTYYSAATNPHWTHWHTQQPMKPTAGWAHYWSRADLAAAGFLSGWYLTERRKLALRIARSIMMRHVADDIGRCNLKFLIKIKLPIRCHLNVNWKIIGKNTTPLNKSDNSYKLQLAQKVVNSCYNLKFSIINI